MAPYVFDLFFNHNLLNPYSFYFLAQSPQPWPFAVSHPPSYRTVEKGEQVLNFLAPSTAQSVKDMIRWNIDGIYLHSDWWGKIAFRILKRRRRRRKRTGTEWGRVWRKRQKEMGGEGGAGRRGEGEEKVKREGNGKKRVKRRTSLCHC